MPAAGFATRLQPIVGSKEMLAVGRRRLIDFLMETLVGAKPDAIRVVTRPDKTDLRTYAQARGWDVVLGTPPDVAASIALGLDGLEADDVVLVGFPDTAIDARDAAVRTLDALTDDADVALGLFHTPEPWRADVVEVELDGVVTSVEPKPELPGHDLVWGLVTGRVGPLHELCTVTEPGHLWHRWANDPERHGRVRGVVIDGRYRDFGTRAALAELGVGDDTGSTPESR